MEALKELLKKGALIMIAVILTVALIGGIFSAFIASADSSPSSYNGDYEDYVNLGEYIVKTDEDGAMPALTKEQVKYAIEKCYSGQMKENFMSMLDSYIFIQDNYKVNAAFPIAVSIAESSGGTNWDYIDSSTNNIYSIQGKIGGGYQDRNGTWWNVYTSMSDATEKFGELISNNYFTQGKITVSTVGTIYCNPPTAWVNMITPELDKIYSTIAETIPQNGDDGTTAENGDGYDQTFKSSSGKTYKLYIQNRYSNVPYGNGTVSSDGCGPTSAAIVLSGFGKNDTPATVARSYAANGSWAGECKFFTDRGLKAHPEGVDWNKALKHLKEGNPMVASITSGITINGSYYNAHFITFLDYKDNKIFIGDPYNDGNVTGTSWQKVDFLKNSGAFGQFFYVSE